MSCGVGCRRGSDPALLWLWRRLAATAPIRPLAWEPPYAARAAQENGKKTKKKKSKLKQKLNIKSKEMRPKGERKSHAHNFFFFFVFLLLLLLLLLFLGPLPRHMEVPRLGVESEL